MRKKKFSLVFICFNKYLFLKKLIEESMSFIKKNKNLEIIFIDNGSTDDSSKIFFFFKKKKKLKI